MVQEKKSKQMPSIIKTWNRAISSPSPCCNPHCANWRCWTQSVDILGSLPLIYFHVNMFRKQSSVLDSNWLSVLSRKVRKVKNNSLLGNLLYSWRRKEMSNWAKGGSVTPTVLLPTERAEMKLLRIGQSLIYFVMQRCWIPRVKSSCFLAGRGILLVY